ALAHSRLLSSNPVAGSVLDSPPTQIQMGFSEGVGLEFSYIKLLDRSRAEFPVGALSHPGGDPTQVSAGIGSTLRPGTYTVVWRVISGVDGHLTAGSFAFRVRDPSRPGTPEPEETVVPLGTESATPPVEGSAEA